MLGFSMKLKAFPYSSEPCPQTCSRGCLLSRVGVPCPISIVLAHIFKRRSKAEKVTLGRALDPQNRSLARAGTNISQNRIIQKHAIK